MFGASNIQLYAEDGIGQVLVRDVLGGGSPDVIIAEAGAPSAPSDLVSLSQFDGLDNDFINVAIIVR